MTAPTDLRTRSRPPIDVITSPFARFAKMEAAGGILLLLATAAALIWANSQWEHSYHQIWYTQATITLGQVSLSESRHEWVNDGLMSIFFFLVGLEIKREVLIGELSTFKQAAFPFMAAIGGSVVPALIYSAINKGGAGANGWGIPMATDIAFALGVLALLGSRVPPGLKVFVAALAIVDDIFGVLVIALFYTQHISLIALGLAFVGVAVSFGANWLGVRNPVIYALIGVGVWAAVLNSGVHATIAGILLAFTIPARSSIDKAEFLRESRGLLDQFEQNDPNSYQAHHAIHALEQKCEMIESPLHRIEHALATLGRFCDHADLRLRECRGSYSWQDERRAGAPYFAGSDAGIVVGQADRDHVIRATGLGRGSWVAAHGGHVEPDFWRELALRDWVYHVAVYRRTCPGRWGFTGYVEDWDSGGVYRRRVYRQHLSA